jgi:hypothetical protein
MSPTPQNPGPGGTDTSVHITSTTPPAEAPEPSSVMLALLGFIGGTSYRVLRRSR